MIRTDSGYVRQINSIFVAIITIIFFIGLWQIRSILMLAVAGVMLTIFFTMPVRFFMRWKFNRVVSILLSLSSGIILIIILSLVVFPTLFSQFNVLFTSTIPRGFEQLIELWNDKERLYETIPFSEALLSSVDFASFQIDADFLNQAVNQATNAVNSLGGSVLPFLGGVASALLSFIIVFFLCIYFIAEPDKYIQGIILLTPLWYRDRMREILVRLDTTIRAWIKVTLVSMIFVGAGTALGLALLGVEQWLALGVLAGALSFIPNFGTIAAIVPAVAVAIVQVPGSILWVIVMIIAVSFVQSQVIGPILTAESMNLPPVLILVGQIIFGLFFGFLGVMLAVPLTAVSVVLAEEIYIKDLLGDTSSEQEDEIKGREDATVFAETD
jgi:predicted PurR-regulated permease PerM